MAERRMFAKTIIDSDAFIDMPVTARLLYYDLAMRADDDGFVNSPKKIMRMIGASQDDLSILILRKFIIPFETGVVVIKHWRIHNYIRKDMYHETKYKEEKERLELDENNAYTLPVTNHVTNYVTDPLQGCNESGTNPSTQVRLGKVRLELGKDRLDDVCTEPLQSSAPPIAENAPGIPLKGGMEWKPTVAELDEWIKFYSAVDVIRELGRMRIWCNAKPERRKTEKGIRRFVTTWLDKEQNSRSGGRYGHGQQRQATGADAYYEMAQEAINGTGGY